jgi:succinate dehydrogenase/fumarate reductase flavoprotein subunit
MVGQEETCVDLLVIGAGPAGMTTALVGKLEGLDVLLCEKTGQIGGTASTSAGTLWIPGNSQSRKAGYQDSPADAATYMDELIGESKDTRLRDAYLTTGPQAVDYLEAQTDVKFVACGEHPDYRDLKGAAQSGRAIIPATFDARVLGKDFERVRPPMPEFMVFGGMMVGKADIPKLLGRFRSAGNFAYAVKLFGRYLRDRLTYSRGTRLVMGNALVARLFYSLKRQSVPIAFETSLVKLVEESGAVVGAVVADKNGQRTIRARRGVVLATGGYAHSRQLRERFMPAPAPQRSLASPANEGDGISAALAVAARVSDDQQGTGGFWTPVSVSRNRDGTTGLFPHLSLDRAKPGLIAVNGEGKRFVNEADSYHDFVEAMLRDPAISEEAPAWLLCERDFVQKYGLGAIYPETRNLRPFERSGYLMTAPTIAELATKIGVSPDRLSQTVTAYNDDCSDGVDRAFHKGTSALNRFNGDPAVQPNPCLAPIKRGPFCAMAIFPAEIACSKGINTDENGRVLSLTGAPVKGLYACGNDMASIMEGTYPGPGTTLGPAITFGFRIAQMAAGSQARPD